MPVSLRPFRFVWLALPVILAGCDLASLPTGVGPSLVLLSPPPGSPMAGGPSPGPAPSEAPGGTPVTPSSGAVSGEAAIRPLAEAAAERHGVPKPLLLAVCAQESGFNPRAVSAVGALGLMQLMPTTIQDINKAGTVQVLDPFDSAQSLAGGAWYLRWVKAQLPAGQVQAGEEWKFALGGYNGGIGRVKGLISQALAGAPRSPQVRWDDIAPQMPSETRRYVPAVWARYERYQTGS